ncbi:DUF3618 domain-containing protein [Nonomuraea cavernae]|uniref:DUF3618 domain-containing protein n=1 Tax=Nonomuraea cavernae TaxID=2045107 RepID=A0A918DNF4_9ACTN|nr:DUF3618 domain-containing protein [Nonomuraea cavernae]MCA2189240.1 DUF3618 domain-containing protein [Nonomuraea cavernae]GGO76624.1 hypothetical protein GCM10012289_54390 [Nonomuraea cavernae]
MSETDPGYSEEHAGEVGAHRSRVGMPTDDKSINVPPTRAGAAENALHAEEEREEHGKFIPEAPLEDDRAAALRARELETRSLQGGDQAGPAGTHTTTRHTGTGGRRWAVGDDEEERVREEIRTTRQELGETVAALADKANVKARANDAAAAAKVRAADATAAARHKAADATALAKERAADATALARHKASDATAVAKVKASDAAAVAKEKAAEVAGKVREVTPDQVKDAADKVTAEARRRPALAIAAAGVVVALLLRRMTRRTRRK